jgi:hypothetical protein
MIFGEVNAVSAVAGYPISSSGPSLLWEYFHFGLATS